MESNGHSTFRASRESADLPGTHLERLGTHLPKMLTIHTHLIP